MILTLTLLRKPSTHLNLDHKVYDLHPLQPALRHRDYLLLRLFTPRLTVYAEPNWLLSGILTLQP